MSFTNLDSPPSILVIEQCKFDGHINIEFFFQCEQVVFPGTSCFNENDLATRVNLKTCILNQLNQLQYQLQFLFLILKVFSRLLCSAKYLIFLFNCCFYNGSCRQPYILEITDSFQKLLTDHLHGFCKTCLVECKTDMKKPDL